jgi:hypothetical protein
MGLASALLGLVALFVTLGSQLGFGPADFATVAAFGLSVSAFSIVAQIRTGGHAAKAGIVMGLLPLAMLIYFLSVSEG